MKKHFLILALVMGGIVVGCKNKKNNDNGSSPPAQSVVESKTVLSLLGMRHPTFEVDKLIEAGKGYRYGIKTFFGELFAPGASATGIEKVINAGQVNKFVVALTFPRPGGKGPYWKGNFNPSDVTWRLQQVAPIMKLAQSKGAKLYLTIVTEDNEGNCGNKTAGANAARTYLASQGLGSTKIIDNPCSCGPTPGCRGAKGFDLVEAHGSNPAGCPPNGSVDPDGSPMGDGVAWIKRYSACEVLSVWRESYNGKPGPDSPRDRNFSGKIDWAEVRRMIEAGAGTVSIQPIPTLPPSANCTSKDTFVDGAKKNNLYKPVSDNRPAECVVMLKPSFTNTLVAVEFFQNGKKILHQDWDMKNSATPWSTHQGFYSEDGSGRPYVSVNRPKSGAIQVRAINRDGSVVCFDDVNDVNKRYD